MTNTVHSPINLESYREKVTHKAAVSWHLVVEKIIPRNKNVELDFLVFQL